MLKVRQGPGFYCFVKRDGDLYYLSSKQNKIRLTTWSKGEILHKSIFVPNPSMFHAPSDTDESSEFVKPNEPNIEIQPVLRWNPIMPNGECYFHKREYCEHRKEN